MVSCYPGEVSIKGYLYPSWYSDVFVINICVPKFSCLSFLVRLFVCANLCVGVNVSGYLYVFVYVYVCVSVCVY
jgi:hypothetical protein